MPDDYGILPGIDGSSDVVLEYSVSYSAAVVRPVAARMRFPPLKDLEGTAPVKR
jgi:hypothetical protein